MVVIAILGLLVPGYCVARALRAPMTWALAFPFSATLLAETVIAFAIIGVPIRFHNVLAVLVVASLVALAAEAWRRDKRPTASASSQATGNPAARGSKKQRDGRHATPARRFGWLALAVGAACIVILLGMVVRTSLYPLSGYDTSFRWEALSRAMLDQESLSFYPPVTPEDFTVYVYPDGIAPLVGAVYWWLYATYAVPWPVLTSAPIVLQAISCLALVFYTARTLFGPAGGAVALAALVTSTLFFAAVAMGQETGYTALSYAGQLAFALAAVREPRARFAVIAGVFAGMGALAREYGPLLSVAGIAVLATTRETRRMLPLFCLAAALCAAPWYVRNWLLSGNPLYSISVGLIFPVNPVHARIMATCHELFGLAHWSGTDWARNAGKLLAGAPLAIVLGLTGLALAGRQTVSVGLAALVAVLLWLWSVAYTSADVPYTMRVLAPAWVALSIAAGAVGPALERSSGWRAFLFRGGVLVAIVLCGGYAAVYAWSHPFFGRHTRAANWHTTEDPLDWYPGHRAVARALEGTKIPPVGVLTDDCYLATALRRETRFTPVMIWNPQVAFIFDETLDPAEVRRRLCENGVRIVASGGGANALFLHKLPFYRDDSVHWQPLMEMPGTWTVFFLPVPAAAPPPTEPTLQTPDAPPNVDG
ncbi:MAG: glycosyltransferase family 39 protein [Planctomycetia bacterium]|nr:glycosyltransferase family 39 protein [Planctomycetia bacterium]